MKASVAIRQSLSAISMLWVCSLAGAGLAFLTQIVLARTLHPEGYGALSAALATATLMTPLAGFGVQGLWLKVFGAEGWQAMRWLLPSLRLVCMMTAIAGLLLVAWANCGPNDALAKELLLFMFPVVAGYVAADLIGGKLQLEDRYGALAVWQFSPHLARFLLVVLLAMLGTTGQGPDAVAPLYALVALVIGLSAFLQLRSMAHGRFELKGHQRVSEQSAPDYEPVELATMVDVIRQAWPFGLAALFHMVYYQSNIILLKYLSGDAQAGVFGVAFAVMAAVYMLPTVIFQKFLLGKFHRWANHDPSRFLQAYRIGNGYMLLLGFITAVSLAAAVPIAIPALFSPAYKPAIDLLQILVFCVPLRFLATSVGATLVTKKNMQRKTAYMGLVAIISIALNVPLIIIFGAKGAALATLISEMCLLILYLLAVRKHVFGPGAWRGWTLAVKI